MESLQNIVRAVTIGQGGIIGLRNLVTRRSFTGGVVAIATKNGYRLNNIWHNAYLPDETYTDAVPLNAINQKPLDVTNISHTLTIDTKAPEFRVKNVKRNKYLDSNMAAIDEKMAMDMSEEALNSDSEGGNVYRERDYYRIIGFKTDEEKLAEGISIISLGQTKVGLDRAILENEMAEKQRDKAVKRAEYSPNSSFFYTGITGGDTIGYRYSISKRPSSGQTRVSTINDAFRTKPLSSSVSKGYGYIPEQENNADMDTVSNSMLSIDKLNSRLLQSTYKLFEENKIGTIINRFHTEETNFGEDDTVTSYTDKYGMSRGRNLLRKNGASDRESGYENPYCRVWTALHQYGKLKDRIRPFVKNGSFQSVPETWENYGDLRTPAAKELYKKNGVLQPSGYVRMSPQKTESGTPERIKNYMFSIENLAWRNNTSMLSEEQRGPNGGRIMWFPPYNLKFTENIQANWEGNAFIGRGEQIYTYSNTDRSGTLDFTILIDHPSVIDKWRGVSSEVANKEEREQDLLRYFAGCAPLEDFGAEPPKPVVKNDQRDKTKNDDPKKYVERKFVLFFPNDFTGNDYVANKPIKDGGADTAISKLKRYEYKDPIGGGFTERDSDFESEILGEGNDANLDSNLNLNIFDTESSEDKKDKTIKKIADLLQCGTEIRSFHELLENNGYDASGQTLFGESLTDFEIDSVTVDGYASSHGKLANNKKLAKRRAFVIGKITANVLSTVVDENKIRNGKANIIQVKGRDVNKVNVKITRAAIVTIRLKVKDDYNVKSGVVAENGTVMVSQGENLSAKEMAANAVNELKTVTDKAMANSNYYSRDQIEFFEQTDSYRHDVEYMYFSTLKENQPLVYKNIIDKIRFFDPAYHTMTPEGYNARLNFLHQCTRQGPTLGHPKRDESAGDTEESAFSQSAGNLAFGLAPYCILRIGDFFNTKICIDSISINYDSDGIRWDLNPEGVGVQPMMANVSMNFHFIGGSSMGGPVAELQNAISENYYANSSLYNRRAK